VTVADDAIDTDRLPLTTRLERSFAARIGDLDEPTRAALNLAALNDYNVAEIIAATELLVGTATPAVLDPAISAGLISVEGTAIRAGHNALARVLHDSPERALWRSAAAALHPDSALAAALEQSVDRALQRGATSNAVYVLERSAQLSVEIHDRRRRIFRAAALEYTAGRAAQANLVGDGTFFRLRMGRQGRWPNARPAGRGTARGRSSPDQWSARAVPSGAGAVVEVGGECGVAASFHLPAQRRVG
jgi:hypothetical protein